MLPSQLAFSSRFLASPLVVVVPSFVLVVSLVPLVSRCRRSSSIVVVHLPLSSFIFRCRRSSSAVVVRLPSSSFDSSRSLPSPEVF